MTDPDRVTPLPPGTRLVHVGPHKTGTTALQSAFHADRPGLAAQGVHYAGRALQPSAPVTALLGRRPLRGERAGDVDAWHDLAREVRRSRARRVVLSSEYLADLDDDLARRVVEDLGGPDVHVLVTLRPLHRIAPSQWQQYVQNAHLTAWERWLDLVLRHPPYERPSPSFWRRHRHDRLVRRWADVVGPERVTVLVVDERDRTMLTSTVERLLDLRPGSLVPRPDLTNRGLTLPEIEVARRLNAIASRGRWSDGDYADVVRHGAVRALKLVPPDPGDRRMELPDWAGEALTAAAGRVVDGLRASGVRVVGDLDALAAPAPAPTGSGSSLLQLDHAAAAVGGAVLATSARPGGGRARLEDVRTTALLRLLATRSAAWLVARARLALARRSGPGTSR